MPPMVVLGVAYTKAKAGPTEATRYTKLKLSGSVAKIPRVSLGSGLMA